MSQNRIQNALRSSVTNFNNIKIRIVFRFTIGSMDDHILKFWEPNAPSYTNRRAALIKAFNAGYKTSVSCEPFLDYFIRHLVSDIEVYVTDTIWIGKMNRISNRVDTTGWRPGDFRYLEIVQQAQTDDEIIHLYAALKNNQKIKWKDSIKKILNLPEEPIG